MPAPLDAPRAPRLISHFGPALGAPGGVGALLESCERLHHGRLAQIEPLLARPVLLRADVVCGLSPGAAVAGAAGRTRVAEHLSADAVAAAMRSRHAGRDPLTTVAPAPEAPGVPA